MAQSVADSMTDQRRALLTEREREILRGDADVTDNYRYSIESRIRSRLRDRLPGDVDVIREHYPEMFDEILYPLICQPDSEHGDSSDPEKARPAPQQTRDGGPDAGVSGTEPIDGVNVTDRVRAAVERVSASWTDSDDRLSKRREAAAIVLQHALDSGRPVGKSSEIVDAVQTTHLVSGQNPETYWRKNIRPVLSEFGEYNQGAHGYVVDGVAIEHDE